jgi:hypothetical protein
MTPYNVTFLIKNSMPSKLSVMFEPWGEVHELAGGESLRVSLSGAMPTESHQGLVVEMKRPQSIIVWGWSGSFLDIGKTGTDGTDIDSR